MKRLRGIGVALALVAGAALIVITLWQQPAPELARGTGPPPVATAPQAPALAQAASTPQAAPAMASAPPMLDLPQNEPAMTVERIADAIETLVGRKAGLSFFQLEEFPRRLVATIHNLGREHVPPKLWPVAPTPGRFTVDAQAVRCVRRWNPPFPAVSERRIFAKPRFREVSAVCGCLCKQFTIFGQHTHVGCTSVDEALFLLHSDQGGSSEGMV